MNKKILFTLIFGLIATSLVAQSRHYNAMSLGMGGGGTAYSEGYHSNFINPANLMIDNGRPANTLGIVGGLGVRTGGNLANISVYNKYLTEGLVLEGEVRENMLNDWFGTSSANSRELSTSMSVIPLGFSHRNEKSAFSIATRVRVAEDFDLSRGMAELITYGIDSEQFAEPTPINFSSNTVAFAEISVGYARQIMELPELFFARDVKLYAGIAPKYLYGVYTGSIDFNSTLQIQQNNSAAGLNIIHDFDYSLKTIGELSRQMQEFEAAYSNDNEAEFGDYVDYSGDDIGEAQASGVGLDLGATLEMDVSSLPVPLFVDKEKTLRVSMSITDLGKLNYNKDASSVYAEGTFDYSGAGEGDTFENYFENLSDSLQEDIYGDFDSEEIDEISYTLPGMYNFGASLEMGRFLAAIDYGFGFNHNGTNSKRSTLNIGLQYRFFGFVPLRVGTRMGGYSSASFSAGLGVDFNNFAFTVGASNVGNSSKNGASAGVAWSGFIIRF